LPLGTPIVAATATATPLTRDNETASAFAAPYGDIRLGRDKAAPVKIVDPAYQGRTLTSASPDALHSGRITISFFYAFFQKRHNACYLRSAVQINMGSPATTRRIPLGQMRVHFDQISGSPRLPFKLDEPIPRPTHRHTPKPARIKPQKQRSLVQAPYPAFHSKNGARIALVMPTNR